MRTSLMMVLVLAASAACGGSVTPGGPGAGPGGVPGGQPPGVPKEAEVLTGDAALARLDPERRALLLRLAGDVPPEVTVHRETGAVLQLELSPPGAVQEAGGGRRTVSPAQFVSTYLRVLDAGLQPAELVPLQPIAACGDGTMAYTRSVDGTEVLGSRLVLRTGRDGGVRSVENMVAPAHGVLQGKHPDALAVVPLIGRTLPDSVPADRLQSRPVLVPVAQPRAGPGLHPGRVVNWMDANGRLAGAVVLGRDRVIGPLVVGGFDTTLQAEPRYHVGDVSGMPDYITYRPVGGVQVEALPGEVNPAEAVYRYLEAHPEVFRTGAARCQFETRRIQVAPVAGIHMVRMRQSYAGLPVFGAELVFEVQGGSRVMSVMGHALPSIAVDVEPAIDAAAAGARALAAAREALRQSAPAQVDALLRGGVRRVELGVFPGPLVPRRRLSVRLAYRVTLDEFVYFIDAETGGALYAYPTRQAQTLIVNDGLGGNELARLSYVRATQNGVPAAGAPVPPNADVAGVTAALGITSATYAAHGWLGVNGGGSPLVANTNVAMTTSACPNAMFVTVLLQEAFFCLGVATPDIVGHEFTHGVISNSSDLVYMDESGALNESYADIMGSHLFPDAAAPGTVPGWLVMEGSAIATPRNMACPGCLFPGAAVPGTVFPGVANYAAYASRTSPPPPGGGGVGACTVLPTSCDVGWVHFNSGINNLAHVLLTDGTTALGPTVVAPITPGIGRVRGRTLAFLTMTTRLTPWSRMLDAALGTMATCDMLRAAGTPPITVPGDPPALATPFTLAHCDQVPIAYGQVGLTPDLVSGWAAPSLGFTGITPRFTGEATDGGCTVINVLVQMASPSGQLTASLVPATPASFLGIMGVSVVPPGPVGTTGKGHLVSWFNVFGQEPAHFSTVVAPAPAGAANCNTPAGSIPVQRTTAPVDHGWMPWPLGAIDVTGPTASTMNPACVLRATEVELLDDANNVIGGPGPTASNTVTLGFFFGIPITSTRTATVLTTPAGPPNLSAAVGWSQGAFVGTRFRLRYLIDQPATGVVCTP